MNGGTCIELLDKYQCNCPANYHGANCECKWFIELHEIFWLKYCSECSFASPKNTTLICAGFLTHEENNMTTHLHDLS